MCLYVWTCTCRHVYKHVHVPPDTLGTWKWYPTPERYMSLQTPWGPGSGPPCPKCYPRHRIKTNRAIKNQRNRQNTFDAWFTMTFYLCQQVQIILWPIDIFWYEGSVGNTNTSHVREKTCFSYRATAQTRRHICQKNWDLVFRRWYWVGMIWYWQIDIQYWAFNT